MELSKHVRKYGMNISGKEQLIILGFAKALEVIPRTLAQNSGIDSVDVINKLRQKHDLGSDGATWGVDCFKGGICDTYSSFVWEPTMLKANVLAAATEAACTVLSVDQTIKNPKSEQAQQDNRKRQMGRSGGMGRGGMPRK